MRFYVNNKLELLGKIDIEANDGDVDIIINRSY